MLESDKLCPVQLAHEADQADASCARLVQFRVGSLGLCTYTIEDWHVTSVNIRIRLLKRPL